MYARTRNPTIPGVNPKGHGTPGNPTASAVGGCQDNVMCFPEVQKLYKVDIVGRGDKNNPEHYIVIANNILSLMSPWYIWQHGDKVREYAMKKRLGYQLELTPHAVRKRKLP